jgi:subtilisin family serine protease
MSIRPARRSAFLALAAGITTLLLGIALAVLTAGPAGAVARRRASAPVATNRYIVVLADTVNTDAVAGEQAHRYGAQVSYVYRRALHGYAARMTAAQAASLTRDRRVRSVEPDRPVKLRAQVQHRAPWDLDRLDQSGPGLDGAYHPTGDGSGVTAYVIDTGIRLSHHEFGGRAASGFDAVDGGPADDCNGHGTHVAGTIGGKTYGVAKAVQLVAVRVLGCDGSGTTAGVIAGIDWVTTNHRPGTPAVANMSLGGGISTALDQAVRHSITDGVTYAVAAGNDGADACLSSPARVAGAITVGATDRSDARPAWSNLGRCVDLFAPGAGITSAWATSDTAKKVLDGTSMATPHVTGAAALYLQQHPAASPRAVAAGLRAASLAGAVDLGHGQHGNLLHIG